MQASADSARAAAQCPQCGQEFVVESNQPAPLVVKAQVVTERVPLAPPHTPLTPPQAPHGPPHLRPGIPHHGRTLPPVEPAESDHDAFVNKVRIIGLATACIALLVMAICQSAAPMGPDLLVMTEVREACGGGFG